MKAKRLKVGDRTDLLLPPSRRDRLATGLATKVYLPEFVMTKYFPRSERVLHTVRLSLYRTEDGIVGMEIIPLKDSEGLLEVPPLHRIPKLKYTNRWVMREKMRGGEFKNDSSKV